MSNHTDIEANLREAQAIIERGLPGAVEIAVEARMALKAGKFQVSYLAMGHWAQFSAEGWSNHCPQDAARALLIEVRECLRRRAEESAP